MVLSVQHNCLGSTDMETLTFRSRRRSDRITSTVTVQTTDRRKASMCQNHTSSGHFLSLLSQWHVQDTTNFFHQGKHRNCARTDHSVSPFHSHKRICLNKTYRYLAVCSQDRNIAWELLRDTAGQKGEEAKQGH